MEDKNTSWQKIYLRVSLVSARINKIERFDLRVDTHDPWR